MQPKLIVYVSRKKKAASGFLSVLMIVLCVLFLLGGIIFTKGMLFPCFLMAGLYFLYDIFSKRDYEYILENNILRVDVIWGRRFRRTEHEIDLQNLVVLAPHDHEAVAEYRKGASSGRIAKYDYTSYEDGVPYYTLIAYEDRKMVKLLLDLNDEFLARVKQDYPERVFR